MADLDQTIIDNAAAPRNLTIDGQTSTQRSLTEIIEADRYLASKAGVPRSHRGMRLSKVISPGAMST